MVFVNSRNALILNYFERSYWRFCCENQTILDWPIIALGSGTLSLSLASRKIDKYLVLLSSIRYLSLGIENNVAGQYTVLCKSTIFHNSCLLSTHCTHKVYNNDDINMTILNLLDKVERKSDSSNSSRCFENVSLFDQFVII